LPPATMPALLSIQRCASYEQCGAAIAKALTLSGLTERLKNRRVLLKPNLMKAGSPEKCLNTHPQFVAGVIGALGDLGCRVVVGESSGLLGFTDEVFEASGVGHVARSMGAQLVNLDAGPFVTLPHPQKAGPLLVPKILFDVDAVVQVPKLKAHSLTRLSAATKNLVGVLPGATKCDLHVSAPDPAAFADTLLNIVDMLVRSGVHLEGAIVDGIWALAGRTRNDKPIVARPGVVVAGRDLHTVDLACALLLGLDPTTVPTLVRAALRGAPLTLVQEETEPPLPLPSIPAPGSPAGIKDRFSLIAKAHYLMRGRIVNLRHDPALCAGEGACVALCPVGAIRFVGQRAVIGRECVRCLACHERCPTGAMRLETPWVLRQALKARTEGLDTSKLEGRRP